ncbi:MAG: lysostaphin resistance A-like protein [Planctomycetaceae bacterium]
MTSGAEPGIEAAWPVVLVFVGSLTAFVRAATLVAGRLRRGEPLVAERPHAPVPWELGDVVIVVAIYLYGALLLESLTPKPITLFDRLVNGGTLSLAAMLAAIAWLSARGADAAALGFRSPGVGEVIRLAAGGVALVQLPLLLVAAALNALVPYEHPILEYLDKARGPAAAAVVVVSAVVIAPIAEEFFFRRVLQGWLEKRCAGHPWAAVLIASAIFAAAHREQGLAFVPLFPLAIVLGAITERTGSILPAVLLHALFNAVSVFLMLARPGPVPGPAG